MTTGTPPCDWCGEPSTTTVEVEPPVYKFKKAVVPGARREKVMTRRAITATVCQAHAEMVDRERQAKAERVAAERARRERMRVR